MKLAITQIILGLFIASACYFIQEYGVVTSFTHPDLLMTGNRGMLEFKADTTVFIARWILIAAVAMGLAVFYTGIIQVRKIRRYHRTGLKNYAVTEIVLGTAIVVSAVLVLRWGFSSYYNSTTLTPDGLRVFAFDAPHKYGHLPSILTAAVFLVGFAVIGCGIRQYLEARKMGKTND